MAGNSDPPLLKDVEDQYLDLWSEYLGGHWTLTKPECPGIYPIATREGHHVGYREFRLREGELIDTLRAATEPGWQGFYWSFPLPPPPKEVPN